MGIPDTYELIVSIPQLQRIAAALQAYDLTNPLTKQERLDCNLEYLTDGIIGTLEEPSGDGIMHGICL